MPNKLMYIKYSNIFLSLYNYEAARTKMCNSKLWLVIFLNEFCRLIFKILRRFFKYIMWIFKSLEKKCFTGNMSMFFKVNGTKFLHNHWKISKRDSTNLISQNLRKHFSWKGFISVMTILQQKMFNFTNHDYPLV